MHITFRRNLAEHSGQKCLGCAVLLERDVEVHLVGVVAELGAYRRIAPDVPARAVTDRPDLQPHALVLRQAVEVVDDKRLVSAPDVVEVVEDQKAISVG